MPTISVFATAKTAATALWYTISRIFAHTLTRRMFQPVIFNKMELNTAGLPRTRK